MTMRRLQHWFNCSTDSTVCSGPHSCYTQPCLPHYITSAPTYICSAHTANIQPCCHIERTQQSTGGSQKRRDFHLLHTPFTLWHSILNISLVSVPDTPSGSTADTHCTGEWEWSDTQWKWKAIHYNPSKLHFVGFLSFLLLHPWTLKVQQTPITNDKYCKGSLLRCDNWRIDLDEHIRSRINQLIATDCRTFWCRPLSTWWRHAWPKRPAIIDNNWWLILLCTYLIIKIYSQKWLHGFPSRTTPRH